MAEQATVNGRRVPDPNTVQHLFQAIVGIWPLQPPAWASSTPFAGAARRVQREGRPRGEDPHELDRSRRSVRGGAPRGRRALLSPRASPRFLDDLSASSAGRPARTLERACADGAAARRRPAFPTSTRATSSGTSRWSIPTTAGRSISPARAPARPGGARIRGPPPEARRVSPRAARPTGERPTQAPRRPRRAGGAPERPAPFGSPRVCSLAPEGPAAVHVVAFAGASRAAAASSRWFHASRAACRTACRRCSTSRGPAPSPASRRVARPLGLRAQRGNLDAAGGALALDEGFAPRPAALLLDRPRLTEMPWARTGKGRQQDHPARRGRPAPGQRDAREAGSSARSPD